MKKILFLFVFVSTAIAAQIPQLQWAKCLAGNITWGRAVKHDAFGNVYVAGNFAGTFDFDPGPGTYTLASQGFPAQTYDVFICKYSPAGNLLWAKRAGGTQPDYLYSIDLDAAGNVYACGEFQATVDFDPGPATFNLASISSGDIFVWKLDSQGNFIWAKSAAGSSSTEKGVANFLTVDMLSNVYITGDFYGTADFDPGVGTYTVITPQPFVSKSYIWKLNSSGNFMWVKTTGGLDGDRAKSLTLDVNGNILFTGEIYGLVDLDPGPGTFTVTSSGNDGDIFVTKLDASGNFIWGKSLDGIGSYDKAASIITDALSNVYFSGSYKGTIDLDPGSSSQYVTSVGSLYEDMFVEKLDPSGNFIWAKPSGDIGPDYISQMVLDTANNICIAGRYSFNTDFDPGPGFFSLYTSTTTGGGFIWKLDTAGNFIWAGYIGGIPFSIDADTVGNMYVTGTFLDTLDFDPGPTTYTMNAVTGMAMFVLKLGNCSAVSGFVTSQNVTCTGVNDGSITINMAGAPPFSYAWTPVNTNSATLTGLIAGTYSCIATNSCYSSYETTVTLISLNADPTVTAVSSTNAICPGFTTTLSATGANTYSWTTGATSPSIIVSPTASTVYTVTGKNAMGCADSAMQFITVHSLPVISVLSTASLICSGYSVALLAGGANTFTWSNGNFGYAAIITPTITTTYTIAGTSADGCVDSIAYTQNVNACTGVDEHDKYGQLSELKVYPNPNYGRFYISEFENNIGSVVEVYNSFGQFIKRIKIENSIQEININNCPAGFYFVKILIEGSVLSISKIVKD